MEPKHLWSTGLRQVLSFASAQPCVHCTAVGLLSCAHFLLPCNRLHRQWSGPEPGWKWGGGGAGTQMMQSMPKSSTQTQTRAEC